jgi:hypothetical protein
MQHEVNRALVALRDVAGVQGSFALRVTGELVGKDLPAVFHDELFIEVGARLSRLMETLVADGDEISSATLRFDEHRLYVQRFPHGLLAVITVNDVNVAALRMALTLTTRRLEPVLVGLLASHHVGALAPSSEALPGDLAGSQASPRTYRGRTLGG